MNEVSSTEGSTSLVSSADGTRIAYEQLGAGAPVIVIGGASCDRATMRPISEHLARSFAVINYDRRGRGDSGDAPSYSVAREIEDIAALVQQAGGSAAVYGHSSGAALALEAGAAGVPLTRLVLHDAPYAPSEGPLRERARAYGEELGRLLAADRRDDAMALFMTHAGMPAPMIEAARQSPGWPAQAAIAPTLAYDSEIMGDLARGSTVPDEFLPTIEAPVLALCGTESPSFMMEAAIRIAQGVGHGEHLALEGQHHVVAPELLAPVLAGFFG